MSYEVINPEPVSAYMEAHLPDHVVFVRSGAAALDFDDPALRSAGGQLVTLRRASEDRVASEKNDGNETSSVVGINSTKDVCILVSRKRVRQQNDAMRLALATGDQDVIIREIGRQSSYYWGKEAENFLAAGVLKGAFDATQGCLKDTHRHQTGNATGSKLVPASYNGYVDACSLLGDNMSDFAAFVGHPKQYAALKKENAARCADIAVLDENGVQVLSADGRPQTIPFFDGKPWFHSEQFSITKGEGENQLYAMFLLRYGSMVIAPRRDRKIIVDVLPKIPADIITETFDFVPHIYGLAWQTAYPSGGPALSDLATATNWAKATNVQDKEIGVVEYVTN